MSLRHAKSKSKFMIGPEGIVHGVMVKIKNKKKSQNRLAREHKCLNRTESEPVTDNSKDKSSLLLIWILECALST